MHPSSIWNIIRDHSDPFPMNWAWFTVFLFVRMIRTESLMRILDRQSSEIESHTSQMRLRYVVDTWEHAWIYFGIVDLLDQGVFTITIPYVWYVRARIENRSKFMEYGPRPSRNIRKLSVAVIWLLWSGNRPRYRSDSDPNRFFHVLKIFWRPMLEIRLIGDLHVTLYPPRHRESTSFTPLELETKSYTKILKNKKVRSMQSVTFFKNWQDAI